MPEQKAAVLSNPRSPRVRAGIRPAQLFATRIEPIESILLFVALILILNTFRAPLLGSEEMTNGRELRETGTALFQIVSLTVYAPAAALLLLRSPNWLSRLLIGSWPLVALVALAVASALWSDEFGVTFRRAVAMSLTTIFAVYAVARFRLPEFCRILFFACVAYVLAGYLATLIPGTGITPPGLHGLSWRGFTGHKNEFGRICALILALSVILWLARAGIWRRYGLALAIGVLPPLYLSESTTSVVTAIFAVVGAIALRFSFGQDIGRVRIAWDIRVLVVVVVPIIAISAVSLIGIESILAAFGKSITLTGRTKLWAYAFDLGMEHPLLGAGYRDFWTDRLTATFIQLFYWDDAREGMEFSGPGNGHNGYLDLFLELGLTGVVLYGALQVSAVWRVAHCFATWKSLEAWTLAMIFCFLLTYSIAEKVILQHTEGVWFLFITFYLYAGRVLLAGR